MSSGEDGSDTRLTATVLDRGINVGREPEVTREIEGTGNGPIAALWTRSTALASWLPCSITRSIRWASARTRAASYVQCEVGQEDEEKRVVWGVGIDSSIITSSLKAIISAINRSNR